MKITIYKPCLGCLTGAALALAALQPAAACEAHAATATQTAETRNMPSGAVTARDAWVPLAPPGVRAHAAYLVLANGGGAARAITAVHSPQYRSAALHVSETKDGIATMQHLAQVDLPSGATVAFKPHGLHVMLMGPMGPQAPGDEIQLRFTLDDGAVLDVTAEVRRRMPTGAGAPGQTGHGTMPHDHKGS